MLISLGAYLGAIAWSSAHHRLAVAPLLQLLLYLICFLAALRQRNAPQSFLRAALKVAERTPGSGIHVLLPDLRVVASDRFQYGRAMRKETREAVERIEWLTAAFQDLPLPAAAPHQNADTLPVPAGRKEAKPCAVLRGEE